MNFIIILIKYLIFGIIQGFCEAIPISSSGHFAIYQSVINNYNSNSLPPNFFSFEIFISGGSLIAVIYYYRHYLKELFRSLIGYLIFDNKKEIFLPGFRYSLLLIIATIPTCIVGYYFSNNYDYFFNDTKLVGCMFLITAISLLLTHKFGYYGTRNNRKLNLVDACKIGLLQLFSLLPGVSRCALTINGGMLSGLTSKTAMDFSFLMLIPVNLGSIIIKLNEVIFIKELIIPYLIAFLGSIFATYLGINILTKIIRYHLFDKLAFYCLILGIITILFL